MDNPKNRPRSEVEKIEFAIKKLEGDDKGGVAGRALSTAGGAAGGAAAAGGIAGAAGASTLLGSSTLGSLLGGVFVTSTPVGWIIGCAVLAGAAGFGIAKLVQSGERNDEVRRSLKGRLETRIHKHVPPRQEEALRLLAELEAKGRIDPAQIVRIRSTLGSGALAPEIAIRRMQSLLVSEEK